ncbi:MAG: hypothetical protein HF314_03960 [Ignavibacteria bacterium]|jgi:hypothetical protein|nr:hypothetical protein [Ignavibacteria bacterium]MCU7502207.1 hypothetical protein [Ignavibacteria bacterium]MCU7517424.1 hypothetical protein [Ignavibacteria bacterium]
MEPLELIGYLASLLVAASLTMSNIWKLRWINLTGALMFVIYALSVHAYPVFAVNGFIVIVDIYYLLQLSKKKDYFTHISTSMSDPLMKKFLSFYENDIQKYFPGFEPGSLKTPECFFILRNLIPVGLFIYESDGEGRAIVKLDYVIPEYRDFKNANFVYTSKSDLFKEKRFRSFVTQSSVKEHQQYLKKIGFRQSAADSTLFERKID